MPIKKYFVIPVLFLFNFTYSQQVLINENFDNGLPADWTHCSGNWTRIPQWKVDSGALRESSGPYFGGVLNGILLPPVDLTLIADPVLKFDLAMAVIDTNIQFSVWYTTDSACNQVWDTVDNRYILAGWNLLSTYGHANVAADPNWTPPSTDYQTISIDLSQLKDSTDIRFVLVSDYMNAYAFGVWYLDNVKIQDSSYTGVSEFSPSPSFRLFPNPANELVRFIPDKHIKNATLIITDMAGSIVLEKSTYSVIEEIDISSYESGIYFVHYRSEKSTSIKKLIIH